MTIPASVMPFIYLAVMAGVTWLIRMIPFTAFRKSITSPFLKSFIFYIPYTVLGAMTFPAVFYATGSLPASIAATLVALVLAFFRRSLLVVALGASAGALLVQLLLPLLSFA